MSLRADTVLNWSFHVVNPSSVWDSLYVYLWLVYTCCIEGGMCGVVWLLGDIVGMPQSSSRRSGVTAALLNKAPPPPFDITVCYDLLCLPLAVCR